MNDTIIEYLLYATVFSSVTYIAFTFITEASEAAGDFRDQQLQEGDSTLAELYINLSPATLLVLRLLATALVFSFAFLGAGLIIAVVLGALTFFAPVLVLNNLKQKRVRKLETQLVEALELLGNSLKSGLTIQQAMELVVKEFPPPIKQEFSLVLSESRLGVEFTEALENMATRLQSNICAILAAGVGITKRVGGDLTQIFTNIAQTIREQANIEGKLDAVTAQGRFQGLILGMMPFALIIVLYFVDRSHVETLFGFKLGHIALAAVVGMVIIAQAWIRKLLAIDV